MPAGNLFGALFFLLLITASLSSCIGIAESVVSWVKEKLQIERTKGILLTASAAWILGFLSIMSLGAWSEFYPLNFIPLFEGKTIFDTLDFMAANILLLIGSMLLSIFLGWFVSQDLTKRETGIENKAYFKSWLIMVRFVAPIFLFVILFMAFAE